MNNLKIAVVLCSLLLSFSAHAANEIVVKPGSKACVITVSNYGSPAEVRYSCDGAPATTLVCYGNSNYNIGEECISNYLSQFMAQNMTLTNCTDTTRPSTDTLITHCYLIAK